MLFCLRVGGVHLSYQVIWKTPGYFVFPQMPTQTKIRNSWNSGVQRVFRGLEQAPQTAWELGTKGASNAKEFIKEQIK